MKHHSLWCLFIKQCFFYGSKRKTRNILLWVYLFYTQEDASPPHKNWYFFLAHIKAISIVIKIICIILCIWGQLKNWGYPISVMTFTEAFVLQCTKALVQKTKKKNIKYLRLREPYEIDTKRCFQLISLFNLMLFLICKYVK